MSFVWPEMLWLLLAVPAAVAAYLWLLGRRKKLAVRYSSLSLVREAMGPGSRWRRHVPPALFLLALTAILLAAARPTAVVTLPSQQRTVILAIDVSGSMRAVDVLPNRLEAAQAAARAFVADVPRSTRIGVVSFAGAASVVQAPTTSHEDVIAAIDRFQLQRGTAIGSGILLSLAELFPDAGIDLEAMGGRRGDRSPLDRSVAGRGGSAERARGDKPEPPPFTPVEPGSYASAAIILLTDGQRTTGPDPLDAAKMAAERGVRVYTVGVGTPDGEIIGFEGWSMRVRLDEPTLKSIAQMTRAEYFYAGTAADLKKVYQTLNSRLVMEKKQTEVGALFAAAGAALALASALLSVLWFNRIL